MGFKKIDNGVVVSYDNGFTIKLRVEGNKLHLKEELNGRPVTDSLFYLNDDQVRGIKQALKNAKDVNEVMQLLQGVAK